ncbi:hypothetical protein Trco_008469 [Trichoderma cornu-damae]|uniref:Uncharacterized protein n=1 Tax=Trichoderma cornu-damae TaxID=654480 RepID=A0A9P8TSU5_9HYPO|nr:hypothetical protein Trco_008469 [Trichoderma cornu-damae]
MPSPSSAQQKVLLSQFVTLTGVSERQATRRFSYPSVRSLTRSGVQYLKSAGYKLNEAVDAPSDIPRIRLLTALLGQFR